MMRQPKPLYLTTLCLTLLSLLLVRPEVAASDAQAQGGDPPARYTFEQTLQFDHLTSQQGLATERIQTIIQDRQGFIWLGTWNGLYRYDGHSLKLYQHNPADPHSLGRNMINVLHVDRAGKLWVGLTGAGVDRFDPVSEQFSHYPADPTAPDKIFTSRTVGIMEDAAGDIWFATQGQGLYRLDPASGQLRSFRHNPAEPHSIGSDIPLSLLFDQAGQLWVGTDRGLDCLNPATGHFTHYLNNPDKPQNLLKSQILSLAEDPSGDLWLGVYEAGLHRFNPRSGELTRYVNDPADPYSLSNNNVHKVYVNAAGTLWVGTHAGGLNRYEPETGRFYRYQHDANHPTSLLQGAVKNIFEDRIGSLWLAVDGGGVSVWHPAKTVFRHYAAHPNPNLQPDSLSVDAVRAIYQDKSGIIWIGTATDGLNRLDPATGQFTYYRHNPADPRSLTGNNLYAVFEDHTGALWVGGFTGLNRLDRATGQFARYQHNPADPHSLSANFVQAITEDEHGNLWLGTGAGLNRFNRATGQFTAFRLQPEAPDSFSQGEVLSLYPAADGAVWAGTSQGGLNRFDPATGQVTRYRHDPDDPNSLSSDTVYGLYQDKNGQVWVATRTGLNRLDPASGQVTRYTRQNGLPADLVIGILEDEQGYLWLSTFNGLSRFDPRSETFKNFDHTDGLNNFEYDFYAYHRTQDGRLWFGGRNGIDIVDPSRLVENPHAPPVVLTHLEINNQPVPSGGDARLSQAITMAEALTLTYDDRVVRFEFAALNFVNPQKNRYKHKLEGFDRDWVETTADRPFATYTNLTPGDYVFRVMGANNDGVWNETGVSLRLTMTPAWWQTWWFYTLAGVGVLTVFAVVYQAKANQLRAEKRAAAAIRESEEKYRVLFESFPLGITVTDQSGHILETNPTAETLVGLPKAAHEGRDLSSPAWHIIYPDGRPMPSTEYASVKALLERRRIENAEMGIIKPGNEITWLNVTAAPIPLEGYGVVVSYGDITARKQVEEKLQRVQYSLDRVADSVFWVGSDGRFIDVNEAACQNLGYSRAELLTMKVFDIDPEWSEETWPSGRQDIQHRQMLLIESVHQKKNGDRFPVEIAAYYQQFGGLKYACVFARDITQRKQAEEEIRFQSQILLHISEGVYLVPVRDNKIIYANPAFERMFGYQPGELLGQPVSILNAPDLQNPVETAAQISRMVAETGTWRGEIRNLKKDGTIFWCYASVTSFDHPRYGPVWISVHQDITERKQAEVKMRLQATLLDAVGQAVIATDPGGAITYFNRAAEKLYGWPAAEAAGRNILEVTVPAFSQAQAAQIMTILSRGHIWSGEFLVQHRSGSTFPAQVYNSPILDETGQVMGIIGISTDISEQKQREQEHVRQERLAAVGQLAAGIAHDFNNILTGIIGFAELLIYRPDVPESARADLDRIAHQGHRAAQLTRQILDFSRQSVIKLHPLDLKSYLNEILKFLERTIPETVKIQFAYDPLDYTINADPASLQHVITNLAVNARDAMPRGGLLVFDLARITLAPGQPPPCPDMPAGEWVKLTVTDTGSGIAPEALSHIFEPFFTTKEVGKGTGLGLAQVYGIVTQHYGYIRVDSRPGRGASFSLYFPALVAQATAPAKGNENIPLGQGETILLVEDDEMVRDVTLHVLESLSYRVLTAQNGSEALTLCQRRTDEIALVLTDALMPIMDGFALASALQAAAPELKVILMSGYAGLSESASDLPPNVITQLQKPMNLHQLAQALREALS